MLALLAARPDIAARTQGVLSFAGALKGSPLADDLRALYAATLAWLPLPGCDRGEGDPVGDLTLGAREAFWANDALRTDVPIYSIVTMPDLAGCLPRCCPRTCGSRTWEAATTACCSCATRWCPAPRMLGIVNADHLRVAIPFPGPAYVAALQCAAASACRAAARGDGRDR